MFVIAENRKTLITGGAGGFGFGVAERLVAVGARVAIADVSEAGLTAAAAKLGPNATTVVMDVSSSTSVREGIAVAADAMGGIDTVVNSAGVFEFGALADISEEEWDTMMGVNLKGVFLVCQAALPHLEKSARGRVVNVSSDAGKKGWPLLTAYSASKFGVVGLTESLAAELGPKGITVNAVCPSTVPDTGMGAKVLSQKVELFGKPADQVLAEGAEAYPLKRLGTVADVADAIMFLISDNAGWITGESINIDGGSLAG